MQDGVGSGIAINFFNRPMQGTRATMLRTRGLILLTFGIATGFSSALVAQDALRDYGNSRLIRQRDGVAAYLGDAHPHTIEMNRRLQQDTFWFRNPEVITRTPSTNRNEAVVRLLRPLQRRVELLEHEIRVLNSRATESTPAVDGTNSQILDTP